MRYTINTLSEINQRFLSRHNSLEQYDVDMANNFIRLIETSRSKKTPKAGDLVLYTNEYGDYYSSAHIEEIENGKVHLCEQASVYVCDNSSVSEGFICSSSGGTWSSIPVEKFYYVGTKEKRFWHFGHLGACADGGIDFYATVNVWECSLNKQPFSTKTHDKYYLFRSGCKGNYHYFTRGTCGCAWEKKEELQAWLRTHRAVIVDNIAWVYKEVEHHVSPNEFDSLNIPEDIFLMNGSKRRCKRIYDDQKYIMHTYFVWYWKTDNVAGGTIDFQKVAEEQNKAINSYKVDDFKSAVNIIALNELRSGKIKPIDIKFI